MLPPGHIAAGFLAAKAYESIFHPALTIAQGHALLWLGAFFGFIPDIDMFFAFFKLKSLTIQSEKVNHRAFLTHVPWLWMLGGLLIALIGKLSGNPFTVSIGFMLWIGTWSHFLLDSIYFGVQWLWPVNTKCYSLFDLQPGALPNPPDASFITYWLRFIRNYFTEQPTTAWLEIVLLILGLTFLL